MRELLILVGNPDSLKLFVVQLSELKVAYFFKVDFLSLSFYAKTKKNMFLPWGSWEIQKNKNTYRPCY